MTTAHPAPRLIPLENGESLPRDEFFLRWETMPDGNHAERKNAAEGTTGWRLV